ncbi:MAG: hypothetical protein AAF732_07055 [Pseudomonadota bacterium]
MITDHWTIIAIFVVGTALSFLPIYYCLARVLGKDTESADAELAMDTSASGPAPSRADFAQMLRSEVSRRVVSLLEPFARADNETSKLSGTPRERLAPDRLASLSDAIGELFSPSAASAFEQCVTLLRGKRTMSASDVRAQVRSTLAIIQREAAMTPDGRNLNTATGRV